MDESASGLKEIETLAGQNPSAPKRPRGRYEQETAEKKAFGDRLRRAREVAGLTLTEAAEALGYSQPVQLSLMENGFRPTPLPVLVDCAKLFGTTMDFLCGLVSDLDTDPAVSAQREIAARLAVELRQTIAATTSAAVELIRETRPSLNKVVVFSKNVVRASLQLDRIRALNPDFDEEVRGAALLVRLLAEAESDAQQHLAAASRAMRQAEQTARPQLAAAVAGLDLDLDLERILAPFTPLPRSDNEGRDETDEEHAAIGQS